MTKNNSFKNFGSRLASEILKCIVCGLALVVWFLSVFGPTVQLEIVRFFTVQFVAFRIVCFLFSISFIS